MNPIIVRLLALGVVGLLAAGCATAPSVPRVTYPVTYNVPVSSTAVRANAGPQNLEVTAAQRVSVDPGRRMFYRVQSPVDVTMFVYQIPSPGTRSMIGQMQGTNFTSSVIPNAPDLEFVFQATQTNSSGTLQFTLSDEPIAPTVAQ